MEMLEAPGRVLSDVALEEVRDRIVDIVVDTFRTRPMPFNNITEKEMLLRQEVAVEIWNHLYGECRWSREKALDHISPLLLTCIDGAKLADVVPEPASKADQREGHTMWAPDKLQEAETERRLSALAVGTAVVVQQDVSKCKGTDDNGGHDEQ